MLHNVVSVQCEISFTSESSWLWLPFGQRVVWLFLAWLQKGELGRAKLICARAQLANEARTDPMLRRMAFETALKSSLTLCIFLWPMQSMKLWNPGALRSSSSEILGLQLTGGRDGF